MSEVLRLSLSVARSGWRATYNRTFRFSKVKSAVIILLIQAGFVVFIASRASARTAGIPANGLGGLMALMCLQMGWFGMMYGFARGQFQLYQGILVPLFQMTPARPLAFLLGRVIEAAPTRAWSALLWAWAYSSMIPGGARWGAMALLWAAGTAVGLVAQLSGLLLLTSWSRYSPKTMRNGSLFFGVVTLALATWAVIFLAEGGTVADLATIMRQYRQPVIAGVVALGGIPGLLLAVGAILRPEAVEDLYRRGVYQVLELAETDVSRPGRSLWLPIPDNVLRAVLSREWLELSRARIVRIQLMIWAAGLVGVFFTGRDLAGAPIEAVVLYVGALSLVVWFLAFGHWVVRVFEKERITVLLYRLAAIPTPRLLIAKFISIFTPSAALVAVATLVGGAAAGLDAGDMLTAMAWAVGALLAGTLGGLGMAAATAGEEPEEQEVAAAPRREGAAPQPVGNAWYSVARTVALVVTAALPIWTGAGQPGLPGVIPAPLLWAIDILLPLGLLAGGSWLMVRSWDKNG